MIEVNPANYYVNPPQTWEKRLLRLLLERGCRIDDFRCVWVCTEAPAIVEESRMVRFDGNRIDEFIEVDRKIEPQRTWTPADRAAVSQEGWFHYVGFDGTEPGAAGAMIVNQSIAYLANWFTRNDARGKGFQQEGIRRRVSDAFALVCRCAFTVTDFNFTSPRSIIPRMP